jgi:hypothetical protein
MVVKPPCAVRMEGYQEAFLDGQPHKVLFVPAKAHGKAKCQGGVVRQQGPNLRD